jgi:hypothetical protein
MHIYIYIYIETNVSYNLYKDDIEEANAIQSEIIRLCGGNPEGEDENENENLNRNENENVIVTKSIKSDKSVDIDDNIDKNVSITKKSEDSTMIDKVPIDDDADKNLKIDDEKDLKIDKKNISNIPSNLNYSTRSRKSVK